MDGTRRYARPWMHLSMIRPRTTEAGFKIKLGCTRSMVLRPHRDNSVTRMASTSRACERAITFLRSTVGLGIGGFLVDADDLEAATLGKVRRSRSPADRMIDRQWKRG